VKLSIKSYASLSDAFFFTSARNKRELKSSYCSQQIS